MTKKHKKLLLKDLSARLPYHVKCKIWLKDGTTEEGLLDLQHNYNDVLRDAFYYDKIVDIKPYLRPMSRMTKEEKLHIKLNYHFYYHDEILDNINIFEAGGYYDRDGNYDPPCEYREIEHVTIKEVIEFVNWLNAHHFDYRGLIEKGLALKAPEGMYKPAM